MIYGIGTDIVELARLERIYRRFGMALPLRILSAAEMNEWQCASRPLPFLGKRFAAKEAFAKAVGSGLRHPVSLQQLALVHDAAGKPMFAYEPELAAWLKARGIGRVHISVSDEKSVVVAYALAEKAVP